METENSVIAQLRVLKRRLRNDENNSSSLIQASRSKFCQSTNVVDVNVNIISYFIKSKFVP